MFSFFTDFFDSGTSSQMSDTPGIPLPSQKPSPSNDKLNVANTLTLVESGIGAIGSIWGGFASSQSSQVRADILSFNADTYRQSAREIMEVGRFNAQRIQQEARQLIGTQRTSLAANGIRLDQDTALDLVSETAGVGSVDALLSIANAERDALQVLRKANVESMESDLERDIGKAQIRRGIGEAAIRGVQGYQEISQRNEDFSGANR